MKKLTLILLLAAAAAKAGDFSIVPDYRDPYWNQHYAYVLKDTAGNIIASWSKIGGNPFMSGSGYWSFHDPYNKLSIHIGTTGAVTDWTFN